MDLEKIAAEIGIDTATLKSLYRRFIETTRKDLAELKVNIESGDPQKVKAAAHHIKGAAINLDLQKLSELAKALEDAAKSENWDDIPSKYNQLVSTYKIEEAKISNALQ